MADWRAYALGRTRSRVGRTILTSSPAYQVARRLEQRNHSAAYDRTEEKVVVRVEPALDFKTLDEF